MVSSINPDAFSQSNEAPYASGVKPQSSPANHALFIAASFSIQMKDIGLKAGDFSDKVVLSTKAKSPLKFP
ncbi:hypothetical protein A9993_07305 [Rahnella victoriana]|nr:hypothetical protein A9993_07305 [Rahnella victoriana]